MLLVLFSLFILVMFSYSCSAKDEAVSCVYLEDCVLPCRSKTRRPQNTIQWTKTDGGLRVHSFRQGQNQDLDQYPDYGGRTSLFEEEMSSGNASLLLRDVTLGDQGRYLCWVNGDEIFVNMKVFALVRDVSLEEDEERLKCESRDIFPKPSVSWSPQRNPSTSVTPSGTGLFSVLSSVPLTKHLEEEYSCNVSTEHSWRSATYRRTELTCVSGYEMTLCCADSNSKVKSLKWIFNHTQSICHRTGDQVIFSPDWRPFVKHVSDSGNLTLKNLSTFQQGLFSCVLTTDAETHVSSTALQILPQPDQDFYIRIVIYLILGVSVIDLVIAFGLIMYGYVVVEKKRQYGSSK